jgi:hypothetical protein
MTKSEELYKKIGEDLIKNNAGIEFSQMFGKPCLKINGKAFASFFQDEMVFKLTGDDHQLALAIKGAKLFDPSGKGRAMKEWVQIPFSSGGEWKAFSAKALLLVEAVNKK